MKTDFLGIKNQNWQSAARDLGAHSLMLYLYLASNANGYELALSPAAITDAIGMPRSTYHDQFAKLVRKGYLVPSHGNTFDFYETPQPRDGGQVQEERSASDDVLRADQNPVANAAQNVGVPNTEINNKENINNNKILNNPSPLWMPKETVITIPVPTVKAKKELAKRPEKEAFVF